MVDHAQLAAGLRVPHHHPMVDIRAGRFGGGIYRHCNREFPGDESGLDEPGEDVAE